MLIDFEISELDRRLANMIRIGRISAVDYAGSIPKARVIIGALTTAWLPLMSVRAGIDKSWWPVEVDEQVVVLSPSGNLTQGVIIGALCQTRFPASADNANVHRSSYADGAVIEYDRENHRLQARLPRGAIVRVEADGGIHIIGDVHVTGNITATQEITDRVRSMQADRVIFNSHTHGGVRTGGSTTATPGEQQ